MAEQPISLVLERLAALRSLLPPERANPLSRDSTWLRPAAGDERLSWVLRQAGAILIEMDAEARLVYVSPNVEEILGHPPTDFEGHYVGDAVHPGDLERLVDVSLAMGEGTPPDRTRLRVQHRDGSWVHLEAVSAARFRADDGSIHSVSVLCDVTARQHAWNQLRESEIRYRVIAEASRDAIAEVDESNALTFSVGLDEVLGYSGEELHEMPPFAVTHEDDRERVRKSLGEAFATGNPTSIEPFRVYRKDGSLLWYECEGITYRSSEGSRRFLTIGRDVTDQVLKQQEKRAFEVRSQQAQRLEGLGLLAGGIAHDFNNLLTPILGETRLVIADLPEDSPLRTRLQRSLRAAQRAAELTQQMLANAGAETVRAKPLDVTHLIEEMAHLVPASKGIELRYDLAPGLSQIEGDASQLGQVFSNLMINAIEAIDPAQGGRIEIRTGGIELAERLDSTPLGSTDPLSPGHHVFLEIEDDGCGMDDETQSRIFDPFYTTKFTGRGLGLAAVLGIVRSHQGGIDIDSKVGRGTRFRILLPVESDGAA